MLTFVNFIINYITAERARIKGASGFIEDGRVNGASSPHSPLTAAYSCTPGDLALSRAFGDFKFKKNSSLGPEDQIITANPDITCHEIGDNDEFLVLACDGVDRITLPLSLILNLFWFRYLGLSDVTASC
jgi:serine/threonine protein phosphatase PrpC